MRYVSRLVILFSLAVAGVQIAPAAAEKRVALVIGNSAYQHTRYLPNPTNDAAAIAKLLRENGFADVTLKNDLDYRALREAVRAFGAAVREADIALIYYGGHGVEVAGENYLVPVDAKLVRDADLEYEAVTLASVLSAVGRAKRLRVVILDACRNNPLGESMALGAGVTRSVTRGLARVEPKGDVLVAYSARAGTLAQDGRGKHSPYAEALLRHIMTPGLDVRLMFGKVRDQVLLATGREQEPFIYGSLSGDVITLVPNPLAPKMPTPVATQAPKATPGSEAAEAWGVAKDSSSIAVLEAFRRQYGASNAFYDRLAEARIEELRKQQLALLKAEDERKRAEADLLRPGREFRNCSDVCPTMVVVPAGEFMMGSPPGEAGRNSDEGPQRKVTIARPFAVGNFEVTFAEWDACVAEGGCTHRPDDGGWGRGRRPVINVSWHHAKEYVAWLSRKTAKIYRLLSEAEWEYAARAGTTTRYAFGETISESQAQFSAGKTAEVGSFPANKFGLHDMHGNAWEWVEDNWHPNGHGGLLPAPRRMKDLASSRETAKEGRFIGWWHQPHDPT